jgi:hypothetical protein
MKGKKPVLTVPFWVGIAGARVAGWILLLLAFGAARSAYSQAGNPPATIEGQLVNTRGAGVANAIVQWSIVGPVNQGQTGTSDSGGNFAFEIPSAAPGQVQIATIANLYQPAQTSVQFAPGQIITVRIVLTPKPSAQLGAVSGVVRNAQTRQPVANATVSILGAGAVLTRSTNASGGFHFGSVGFNSSLTLQATTTVGPCIAPTELPLSVSQSSLTVNVQAQSGSGFSQVCRNNLTTPTGTGATLGIDDTLQWQQADVLSIQNNQQGLPNAWYAGHVNDVIRLPPGLGLLVASDKGGVWAIAENAPKTALPLSNTWPSITMTSLALGPGGPGDVYAGTWNDSPSSEGGDLWETDTSQAFPLFNWQLVNPKPPCITINKILVITEVQIIVLACDGGLWWSNIPPTPSVHGVYSWNEAHPTGVGIQRFSGLAKGTGWVVGGGLTGSIVASRWGGAAPGAIIYTGVWQKGNLVLTPSSVGTTTIPLGRTSVATCASNPSLMYAVSADSGDSNMAGVWQSTTGGTSWNPVSLPSNAGKQGGYNNAIAVAGDCSAVAVGWQGGTFVSNNGGSTWKQLTETGTYTDLHGDVHALVFDPVDPTTVFIGSDGGVASASGLPTPTYESDWNRELFNLQFYQGAASASSNGLVAGAAQDNGVLYASLPGPWQHVTDCSCDGVGSLFVTPTSPPPGLDLFIEEEAAFPTYYPFTSVGALNGFIPYNAQTAIPVSPPSTNAVTGGVAAPVRFPGGWASPSGDAMVGVSAWQSSVFGLFASSNGSSVYWLPLGQIGGGQNASAVAPTYNGGSVFVGTDTGNTYRLDAPYTSPALLLAVNQPAVGNPAVAGLYAFFSTVAYAAYNVSGSGYVMYWDGTSWNSVGTAVLPHNLPFQSIMAKDLNTLYVASTIAVYDSYDAGNSWSSASIGLPANITTTTDLHLVTEPSATTYLYLATYGRSLWRTPIP